MKSLLLLTAILSIFASTTNGHAIHLNATKERNDLNVSALIIARQFSSSLAVAAATATPTPSIDPTTTTPPRETNPTVTSPAPTSTIAPPPPAPSTPDQSSSEKDAVFLCVGLFVLRPARGFAPRVQKILSQEIQACACGAANAANRF